MEKKSWTSCGEVSYLSCVLIALACLGIGYRLHNVTPRYAIAARQEVIIQSAIDHQDQTREQLRKEIEQPILRVMKEKLSQGYIIIDAARNENGSFTISGLPPTAVDITDELRQAVNDAIKENTSHAPAAH